MVLETLAFALVFGGAVFAWHMFTQPLKTRSAKTNYGAAEMYPHAKFRDYKPIAHADY